jgi:16S rRNA (uracil1498-N3)-methyltransferase
VSPDRSAPFAFVDDIEAPALDDAARHHLERVRRLRAGDALTVGDGNGRVRPVRFGPSLEPDGAIRSMPPPAPSITIAFALTKGDKPELAVAKMTEVGVDTIAPIVASRTVVRWDDDKAARNVERWRRIAREAAEQAHRPWLPTISDVQPFDEVARAAGATLADPDGVPPSLEHPVVLIGPEGGWTEAELELCPHRTRFAPNVLRSETAAVVAGAVLVALRGNENDPIVRSVPS